VWQHTHRPVSFLLDPPLLYASGAAYGRLVPEPAQGGFAAAAAAATLAVFVGTSASMYLNLGWTRPLARVFRARSGRDWMLNSGVLRLPHRRVGPRTHAAALLLFATYPLWLWLGWDHGRRARPHGR
jgi:hypothetical protein